MNLKEQLIAYELKTSSCGDIQAEIKVDSYLTTVNVFERSYSEEDMRESFIEGRESSWSFNEWFEQFKKK